jgi:hypothetical protein
MKRKLVFHGYFSSLLGVNERPQSKTTYRPASPLRNAYCLMDGAFFARELRRIPVICQKPAATSLAQAS